MHPNLDPQYQIPKQQPGNSEKYDPGFIRAFICYPGYARAALEHVVKLTVNNRQLGVFDLQLWGYKYQLLSTHGSDITTYIFPILHKCKIGLFHEAGYKSICCLCSDKSFHSLTDEAGSRWRETQLWVEAECHPRPWGVQRWQQCWKSVDKKCVSSKALGHSTSTTGWKYDENLMKTQLLQ